MPIETASVRLPASSLPRIEATWNLTVCSEIASRDGVLAAPRSAAQQLAVSASLPPARGQFFFSAANYWVFLNRSDHFLQGERREGREAGPSSSTISNCPMGVRLEILPHVKVW